MPRNTTTTTQRPNGRYFFRTRKPVNYVEEDQPDNKNDPDYDPFEIRQYWIEKHRANKFVNKVKQAIAKINNIEPNYSEPVSLISGIITHSSNQVVTRSNSNSNSNTQTSRYNLRRR